MEDNPDDVTLTLRAINKAGICNKIVVAEDGAEALEVLHGPGEQNLPALVLLDLKLPKVDGLEVLRQIRGDERTWRLPVVVLTSSLEERDLAAAYDLGANSYIAKAVDFEQFSHAVRNVGVYWLMLNQPPPTNRGT